ncbi:c-type cytochrome domain-containing protein [Pelagicoccus albus]|uniref:Cytochrome C Planctomycete-type domain-containing protein n=1 Tax=Pelagicoccus albus TaxID=415222 RepID=A0A7X1B3V1_9BACT|nr:c-type cytochrome domain-containing protein [Pelagicoccus albus]MBC2605042.1 hypothetical protein [Pelagicoccus albus]
MNRYRAFLYALLAFAAALAPFAFEGGDLPENAWLDFLASFHPVVLHLPIGIFAASAILEILGLAGKKTDLGTRNLLWLAISLSASLSFATGYVLGEEGGYPEALLHDHLWAASFFTAISWLSLALNTLIVDRVLRSVSMLAMAGTLLAASHPGGLMVHGDPLQNAPWVAKTTPEQSSELGDIINPYQDLVHPILEAKCIDCHGAEKKKGKLRLDTFDYIMLGGDFGPCVTPGDVSDSLLVELMELPEDDEDRMPPEDEPQLSRYEIDLIKWWIESGASPDQEFARKDAPERVKVYLATRDI